VNFSWIEKILNHSGYFVVCLVLGLVSWYPTFHLIDKDNSKKLSLREIQSIQLSSISQAHRDIASTEYHILQNTTNEDLTKKLEGKRGTWFLKNRDYAHSIEQIQATEARAQKKLPKRFENNPVFKLFEKLTQETASTDYEDILVCDTSRQFYELKFDDMSELKSLFTIRPETEGEFSASCVTYSMRQFNVPSTNYANCNQTTGVPQSPANKPCVTPRLAHLTYNTYKDVMECLDLDPKKYMAKIDFESGFFLNAYGTDREGGIGQLTRPAIVEVNTYFDQYFAEIEKSAATKRSCANLLQYKKYLTKAPASTDQRCSLMALPDNPMKNIFFMALFNRINIDQIGLHFKNYNIKQKLETLGIKNPQMHEFVEIVSMLGYNSGALTAVKMLNTYLEKRIEYNLPLKPEDFNFSAKTKVVDIDGKEKDEVEVARSYVLSSFIGARDSTDVRNIKIARRKEFPKHWALAYEKPFPIFATYRANGYDGNSLDPFPIYGFPGYLSVISQRNEDIRELFINSQLNPDMCTPQKFLKVSEVQ
jgi:hypothetical protein